jgi:hypothetical protein
MSDATPRLGLPWLMPAQAQKHVTVNESLGRLDALVQCAVRSRATTAQPGAPAQGEAWILPGGASGADWDGFAEHDIAYHQDGAWRRIAARAGLTAYVLDEGALLLFDGADWTPITDAITALDNLDRLGVGTTPDASNPFAAKLNTALWTARYAAEGGTGDLRYAMNKEAPGDTVSLVLQSDWSGRAELGLAGSDDFSLKVSADGQVWTEALPVDRTNGAVALGRASIGALTALNGGPLAGFRNAVINGAFDIWQRGAAEFPDRWLSVGASGTVPTVSRQDHEAGQTEVPDAGAHYMRWIATGTAAGAPAIGVNIEDVRTCAGAPSVLSFYARADAARTISVRPVRFFGSGGSALEFGPNHAVGVTTAWRRIEIPVDLASLAGKAIGPGSFVQWRVQGAPGAVDQRLDLDLMQWERGEVATPFEHRGAGAELSLCRRYLEVKTVRSENGPRHVPLAPKRAAPTVAVGVGSAAHITVDGFELSHNAAADCTVIAEAEF